MFRRSIALTVIFIFPSAVCLGETLPGTLFDQDKSHLDSEPLNGDSWHNNWYNDINGNGDYDPGEPWSDIENPGWIYASDDSCWMAVASNIVKYLGGGDRYYYWAYNGTYSDWWGQNTFENGGDAKDILEGLGYTTRSIGGTIEFWGGWWEWLNGIENPADWILTEIQQGSPLRLAIGIVQSGLDGRHALTVYGIDTSNHTIFLADSDNDYFGDFRTCDYVWDGNNFLINVRSHSPSDTANWEYVYNVMSVDMTGLNFLVNPTHGPNGSIFPDSSFTAEYGENVTFYAMKNTGYEVDKWYVNEVEAFTGGDNIVLAITGPTSVYITFKPVSSNVTLTVNASGSGQVKVDGVVRSLPWQGTYASGTVVNLQAIQSTGWTFGYWSGVISSTSNPINVQLNNGGTITANFLNTANMAEVSFDLEPSADAYVSSYRPANNYGSENSLLVGCEQISTVLYSYESLIKFNLPTIASGTSIKDAWLKLTNSGGVGYLQMSVLCNSGSWSESGVTWNNKPSYYTLPKTSINISGNDGFGTTYLLPVQLHLNEWINNSRSNNGFRLTYSAAAGNNYSFIQASETSYNSPPELSFTVYETISNPTSISGVTSGSQGDSLSFAAGGASSNLNHSLQYRFDWGDGDQSSWGSASRSKTYTAVGQYGIRAQARCSSHTDAVSNWSPVLKTATVAASSRSISGYVRDPGDNGIASVTVFANNGGGSTATNSSGYYNLNIPYNWSGWITPMKTGVEFSPVYKEYSFVTSNQTNQNYTGISYAIQVIITPFLASDDGAMWRIDGGTWRPSGYTEENLLAGTHTVDFLSTTNWNAPDSRTVSITGSQSITAHYFHIADLDTDDKINLSDYSLLSDGWQDSPCSSPDWCGGVDINRSGTVGIDDLLIMAEHWLEGNDISEPDGMKWIYIENDPGIPGHEGFSGYISKYETTNAQYCQYLNAALASGDIRIGDDSIVYGRYGSDPNDDYPYYNLEGLGNTYDGATNGGAARINWNGSTFTVIDGFENHPVTHVSWYGAMTFADCYGWSLPTEWEWQAVADYVGTFTYGCGTTINNGIANYLGSVHPQGTTPVGAFDTYGYDMADITGNVWEWTSSCYLSDCSDGNRVLRGGGWKSTFSSCSVAFRNGNAQQSSMGYDNGFRVCRRTSM